MIATEFLEPTSNLLVNPNKLEGARLYGRTQVDRGAQFAAPARVWDAMSLAGIVLPSNVV